MNKSIVIACSAVMMIASGLSVNAATAVAPAIAATAAPVEADSQAMQAADQVGAAKVSIRQQIKNQLASGGYTDVKIMPSSFLVNAKDKMGNPVEMVIGPDSFTEVTEVAPKTAPDNAAPAQAGSTAGVVPAPKS